MSREEIIAFVHENNIDKNSIVHFTIQENDSIVSYIGKFEFRIDGELAIDNEKLGGRIQMIKNADFSPYVGGILFQNLLNIAI